MARPSRPGQKEVVKRLTPDHRRILLDLIAADRPRLSYGQIAKKFRARTGREIDWSTVRAAERHGPPPPTYRGDLSIPERQALRKLIRDDAPRFCRSKIARDLETLTGRKVHRDTVRRYAVEVMGLSPLRRGVNSHPQSGIAGIAARRATVDAQIAVMSPDRFKARSSRRKTR